ncbi:TonB-dependent receptor [Flammeovirga yaeyamensis]|uniref:TonB-dependent receptor n=1 Tax=Flammeovirga yaeyamensis TaxID=367791 RepID=A0AAX1N5U9_9BACT|nr:TonB-dependent receptor [Flammeovirga yaeyamensis]MBB3701280.1 outer membrane receptor for ferrienterochelin and colicins [Flammeovirga yaeyamensis]NMF38250.1 TonB-dependent receptor [Flammeovirga yaeyamensis]QWG02661.1 TonB-dependent receptor [Flammeovirga yaeyamensis]
MLNKYLPDNCNLLYVAIIGFLAFSFNGYSQVKNKIIVTDEGNQPLQAVSISVVEDNTLIGTTSIKGEILNSFRKETVVMIHALGFEDLIVTIKPNKSYIFHLHEKIDELDEVVVTGGFVPTKANQSLYNVKRIGVDEVEARGAVNMSDLLQQQQNIKVIHDNVLGSRIILNGLSGVNVKILMDGLPLVSGSGDDIDLNQLNLNDIERIEVVEGPLSVQYGSNALAGTVNLITKKPLMNEPWRGGVNTYAETVGKFNVDASLRKGWENTSLSLSGGRNQFLGYDLDPNKRGKFWRPNTQYYGNMRVKQQIKNVAVSGFYQQFYEQAQGLGESQLGLNSQINKVSQMARDNEFTTHRINGGVNIDAKLNHRSQLQFMNGISYYEQQTQKFVRDLDYNMEWLSKTESDHDTTSFMTATFRGSYVLSEIGAHNSTWVVGYEANVNRAAGGRVESGSADGYDEYSAYTAYKWQISNEWAFQTAFRYTYNTYFHNGAVQFLGTDIPLVPSFNLLYKPSENWQYRLSYGKGYRVPSMREMFYHMQDQNHYIVGNPDLTPEVGDNINFQTTYSKNVGEWRYSVNTSVFYNNIKNKIEMMEMDRSLLPPDVPENTPVVRTYDNIEEFVSTGFSINLASEYQSRLTIDPGFSFLARSGSEASDQFFNSYEITLRTSYLIRKYDTRINLFYKFNSPYAEFAKEADGTVGTQTLDSYSLLDLTATKPFFNRKLLVTAGAKNLLNVTKVNIYGDGSKGILSRIGTGERPIDYGTQLFIKLGYQF